MRSKSEMKRYAALVLARESRKKKKRRTSYTILISILLAILGMWYGLSKLVRMLYG